MKKYLPVIPLVFGIVLTLVLIGMHSLAQEPTPSPQHKKLGFWIGT
jgi:hypothetical protein